MKQWFKTMALAGSALALTGLALPAWADDDSLRIKNKIEEDFQYRDHVGLSKATTLGQSDLDKDFTPSGGMFDAVKIHAILRASYDATFQLNSGHFGNDAGGAISFNQNGIGAANQLPGSRTDAGPVAWGQGLNLRTLTDGLGTAGPGGPVVTFAPPGQHYVNTNFNMAGNPNQGLALLSGYSGEDRGIDMGVPVRPCDVDHRGCIKGYMDKNAQELAAPEFNKRLDFLREFYVDGSIPVGSNTLDLRLGRQQLVWGRTDLFRVLDVVNPIDYSRNNIYDENSDIRIPMGMLRADYRMGARGPFDDINVQGLWEFENFRPDDLGQAGSTNNPLQAADFFRGMKNCWDNGCTVNNFGAGGNLATNFAPGEIGIRTANIPHGLSHSTYGGKVEGELGGVGFSVNALSTYSQLPSLRGGIVSNDPFNSAAAPAIYPGVIAFDIAFPRVNLYGGSLDFNIEPIDTAIRIETAYTQGEEFANTARSRLFSESDVARYVIGADRNTFIRFLNPNRAFLFSAQMFGTHLMNYELHESPTGRYGMPDWQDNWVATLLIKAWYAHDTISPQLLAAHDFMARANTIEPSVDWQPSNLWRIKIGANMKFGAYKNAFDNDVGATPFAGMPGAAPTIAGGSSPPVALSAGQLAGLLPLGTFRTGILGMAHNESQLFASVALRF